MKHDIEHRSSTVAGVDVGGTFTDAVVLGPAGPSIAKVATTPADQSVGVLDAIRQAQARPDGSPSAGIAALAHGTTTATNAVLERNLDRAALLVTEGFADVLAIGRQNRPSLYDLSVVKPAPAISRDMVIPVPERITVAGRILTRLTAAAIDDVVAATCLLEPTAVAICLLFSWADPRHERALADALSVALPDVHLTVSSSLVGSIREYERASTCALNAAVGPTMSRYLSRLADRFSREDRAADEDRGDGTEPATGKDSPKDGNPDTTLPTITVMTSGGGTADLGRMVLEPVHTLLSGPAGGVVAAADVASRAGYPDAIAFDMGGTSTDVCLISNGVPVVTLAGQLDGLPIGTPTVGIHTVGAGGGSIASLDHGGALQVGPRSAGADPGPACYGRGGRSPTVTDAHAVLGHLTDLAGGQLTPDLDAAQRALGTLDDISAQDILDVVRASMARALRKVSTEAGVDPAGLAVIAYGGAGPLHATALARMLGCPVAVLAPAPGVLSAVGLLTAGQRREESASVMEPVSQIKQTITRLWGPPSPQADIAADMRYVGQAHELRIPLGATTDGATATDAFLTAHQRTYGYTIDNGEVQVVTLRRVRTEAPLQRDGINGWDLGPPTPTTSAAADVGRGRETVQVVARGGLHPGDRIAGPAIITQPDSTALLTHDDDGVVDEHHNLIIRVGR